MIIFFFLQFENEEEKIFDMKPYLKYDIFMPLQDEDQFKDFYIDFGTVCWKCGADLSRDTFYMKGQAIDKQDIINTINVHILIQLITRGLKE